jgi:hypothetical protein
MSDLSDDVKIKRLVRRYGSDGYALYVYIIERIVKKLDTHSPYPDLEETSVDLAEFFGIETTRVEEIIWYLFEVELLSQHELTGRVVAHKIYKFLEASQTRSPKIRDMIKRYRDMVPSQMSETVRDNCEDKKRIEKNRREVEDGVYLTEEQYTKLTERYETGDVDRVLLSIASYQKEKDKQYKDHYLTALKWLGKDERDGKVKQRSVAHTPTCPQCGKVVQSGVCRECKVVVNA